MSHGHHGDGYHHGGYHHGDIHHGHGHPQHVEEPWIGWPLLAVLLRAFWRSRYYDRPRHNRGGGCSIFALMFGILVAVAFIRFWWLLIPIAILGMIGIVFLFKLLRGRFASPSTNSRQFNQPHQANQPYQEGYSVPPPDSQPYQEGYSASPPDSQPYQPYPPQSGWGQYEMPEAQYPQTMPPMQ